MAIVVVGGHSRDVGKTSVMPAIIARLPQIHWTAFKITQFGHGFCTANGEPCDCQTDEHTVAVSEERDGATGTDSARFLAAGAARSFWVRARIGNLAAAMPRLRKELADAENAIVESNSIMGFLRPDLYLSVLDPATGDFKNSARLFIDRADARRLAGPGPALARNFAPARRRYPTLCYRPAGIHERRRDRLCSRSFASGSLVSGPSYEFAKLTSSASCFCGTLVPDSESGF